MVREVRREATNADCSQSAAIAPTSLKRKYSDKSGHNREVGVESCEHRQPPKRYSISNVDRGCLSSIPTIQLMVDKGVALSISIIRKEGDANIYINKKINYIMECVMLL